LAAGQVPATPDVTNVATKVLAAARDALGGDTRLTAIKTFTATGRTQQLRGKNLVSIEFEIVCELPDKGVASGFSRTFSAAGAMPALIS
jgi:hypothetical protein